MRLKQKLALQREIFREARNIIRDNPVISDDELEEALKDEYVPFGEAMGFDIASIIAIITLIMQIIKLLRTTT